MSPAAGTSERPRISTGLEGPAFLTLLPLSSIIALILPKAAPATIGSPTFKVPSCTSTVATGPRPLSSWASIIAPFAGLFGLALSSFISAVRIIISSRVSIPSLVEAETGTQIVSPPQSSDTSPYSTSSCFTLSGFAEGLSILFIATITSTPAAFAWFIASTVWGITPSSADTTRTAISVIWAPLILMAVKASCPGVSRNVIGLPFI